MPANTAHAQDDLPPPRLAQRKPMQRAPAAERSVMFEKPAAPKKRAAPPPPAAQAAEPSFWTHIDGLLEALPVKAAAQALGTRTKALGRDALAGVASLTREWRKGSAPPPPVKAREPVVELGSFLVDLHVAEVRRATDAFLHVITAVARAIDDAETSREVSCSAAHEQLVAIFGDELVGDAAAHQPTQRRMVDMHAKVSLLSSRALSAAMMLLGDDWTRDADGGPGKIVVAGDAWQVEVDVTFATFRVRERATGRHVDFRGGAIEPTNAAAWFTATHFRIAP